MKIRTQVYPYAIDDLVRGILGMGEPINDLQNLLLVGMESLGVITMVTQLERTFGARFEDAD